MDFLKAKNKKSNTSNTGGTSNSLSTREHVTPNVRIIREYKCPKGSTAVSYTDDLDILAVGQEDGTIVLFEKHNDLEAPRVLADYEINQSNEACTDLKIRSSPKGGFNKTLLAGYLNGHIKLWDTTIGKALFTMKENRHLYGLNYHPRSNKFVTVGSDFKVNVYNEERRVTERVFASSDVIGSKNGHTASVCSAVFHPKNNFEIISGGADNTIQFWDLRAPYAIRNIEGVTMYGDALDLTEDGNYILCGVSSSHDSPVQIYDYLTGKIIKENKKTGSFVYCCKFISPSYAAVGGFFNHCFKILNMKTSQVYCQVSNLPSAVMSIAYYKNVPRYRTYPTEFPIVAISVGEKVLEVEIDTPEGAFDRGDPF